jgi:hypothetical protein
MRVVVVVWIAVILIVLSLSFPPYGYSKYTKSTWPRLNGGSGLGEKEDSHESIPWRYVGHRFILSDAPKNDSRLSQEWKSDEFVLVLVTIDNMGIGWHIFAIQIAIVIAISCGLILTFYITKK